MKVILTAFTFLLFTTSLVFAQAKSPLDKTLFNGTWVFDAKASKADSDTKQQYGGHDLIITYVEPELKIIEPQTREGETRYATFVFYTDGRGEKYRPSAFSVDVEFDSVTHWENDVLIRKYKINIYNYGKLVGDDKHIETYVLSPDGTRLTITDESKANFTTDSPYGKLTTNESSKTRRVFRKRQ